MNNRAFVRSALIAGVLMGLLGNLPLLNLVNCILCLWVWLGGFFAVHLYRRSQPDGPALAPAQGAGLGAASGVVGAFTGMLVMLATGSLALPLMNNLARALQIGGDLPFKYGSFADILVQSLIFLVINLFLYPLFGALAGLIGVSLLWKQPAAARPEDAPGDRDLQARNTDNSNTIDPK